MSLHVVPEELLAASAKVAELTARLAAAQASAAPWITAVVPTAADPVSLQTAAGFSAQGQEHIVVASDGAMKLGEAGLGVGESGTNYLIEDDAAAAGYGIAGV